MKREYTFYPGCAPDTSSRGYRDAALAVAEALDLRLEELEDWNCCGATAYIAIDERSAYAVSARNLALAAASGRDVVTLCNGCLCMLRKTQHAMEDLPELRREIEEALAAAGLRYGNKVRLRHFLEVLTEDVGIEEIRRHRRRDLDGLRIAPYYGCQLTRPYGGPEEAERPTSLDALLAALGAEVPPFERKTMCCGGMLMTTAEDAGLLCAGNLLAGARRVGANVIATICPLCQINLEAYQARISRRFGEPLSMGVLPFTKIVGYALGAEPAALRLGEELTASHPLEDLLRQGGEAIRPGGVR